MDVRVETAGVTSREYGPINWVGLQTLIQREINRFLKVGTQTVIAPLISTLLYMMIFSVVRRGHWPGTERNYVDGLAAGLVMMSVLSAAFQNTSSSIVIAKVQGNLVDFMMPPLSALELTIAFIVGATVRGLLVGAASLVAICWIANITPEHVWAVLYYAIAGSMLFGAIGLIGGIWSDKFDNIAAVTNFVVLPLTMLSGTFYSTKMLGEPFVTFAHWNPVFFLMDGFRYGFIGAHDAPLERGALFTAVLAVVLCYVSWSLFKRGYKMRA
jgi:ABC-2 type transport system permease protein